MESKLSIEILSIALSVRQLSLQQTLFKTLLLTLTLELYCNLQDDLNPAAEGNPY